MMINTYNSASPNNNSIIINNNDDDVVVVRDDDDDKGLCSWTLVGFEGPLDEGRAFYEGSCAQRHP